MEIRQYALQALACDTWQGKHEILAVMTPEVALDTKVALEPAQAILGALPACACAARATAGSHAGTPRARYPPASLAHIEFNAINLALDAVWRFPGLPESFYREWVIVAQEESSHFQLLQAHLQRLDHVCRHDFRP